nr:MAG TPA: hypothetical protein [Microviridae sp.]
MFSLIFFILNFGISKSFIFFAHTGPPLNLSRSH